MKIITKIKQILKGKNESEREYRLNRGMKVGENVSIFSWDMIDASHPYLITIGNNVTISANVTILTHDASTNFVQCGTKLGRIKIGNNVFIGTRSIILCNVCIGDNIIVGAGSVVTQDLPANGVYAGVPAKYVCSLDAYKEKYRKLREVRPRFDLQRPWDDWENATENEKQEMADALKDGIGFI